MDDETALLRRAQRHDMTALAEIYDRYAARVYGYVVSCLGERETAEDITAEVFVRMLEALYKARFAHTSLAAWLHRVAHNLVVDHFRKHRRVVVPLDPQVHAAQDQTETVETRLLQEEVGRALDRLTPDQRRVIVLRFGQRMKAVEIAEMLGKSEEAIRALQRRSLASLRKSLEDKR